MAYGEGRPTVWTRPVRPGRSLGDSLAEMLEQERARWFYWVPVAVGCGIATYFALPVEPSLAVSFLPLAFAIALRLAIPRSTLASVLGDTLVLACLGFALIALRAWSVAAPTVAVPSRPVEVRGFVELIEPREERGERVTLLVSAIGFWAQSETPRRVRITFLARHPGLKPGDAVIAQARLLPPAPPALPGDYDFARQAYFQGLGAVGYALRPLMIDHEAADPPLQVRIWSGIARLRQAIGRRVQAAVGGETGAIANALITGECGGISQATNDAFRNSGLFHILSISGLHMAIMGGAVFWSIRALLALFPSVALRYPIKKWAAMAALAGSLAYLTISGGAFATVRSFLTISIMFFAVLWNRPALALRNVALSALVILVVFPESLLDVGFQMSFAAVTALVAVFEMIRERYRERGRADFGPVMRVLLFFGGIVLSTLVASAAVAPFAIYHFHKSQQLAVLANLLAVPLCNIVVMPAALAALLAMPLGLEAGPLWIMARGIDGMVWTADAVASLPGAVTLVPAIPSFAFASMVCGGLWLLLWQGRWRYAGAAAIVAGLAGSPLMRGPDLLIGSEGRLVAVRDGGGHLSARTDAGGAFQLSRWLERDGDSRSTAEASDAARGPFRCDAVGCIAVAKGKRVAIPHHPAAIVDDCAHADILILGAAAPGSCPHPRLVIDGAAISTKGTHAVYLTPEGDMRVETVADVRGRRPWVASARRVPDDGRGAVLPSAAAPR